jgi:parallel beta-helix repeat protein
MRFITAATGVLGMALAQACAPDSLPTSTRATSDGTRQPSHTQWVTSVACGATVTTDLRLEDDLDCAGNAFTVTGSGIQVNLNGHTIAGNGTGNGITVTSSEGVAIHGGTIRGFSVGIFMNVSTGVVVKDAAFTQNATAVLLQGSSGNTLKSIVAWQNTLRAFMLRPTNQGVLSTDNDIVDNQLVDNPTGIYLIRQPGNQIKANTITGSSVAAIDLAPTGTSGTVIKGNQLATNAVGIRFSTGWTGNSILANTFQSNACGVQTLTAGNAIRDNIFTGNTLDYCP